MRLTISALIVACALGPVASAARPASAGARVTFVRSAPTARTIAPSYTAVEYDGKMLVNYSVALKTALHATDVVICEATAVVADVGAAGGVRMLSETASVAATKSGSTATCSVTVPYAWSLASPVQDTVAVSYRVTNLASNGLPALPGRSTAQTIATIALPKSGTTTVFNVKPSL